MHDMNIKIIDEFNLAWLHGKHAVESWELWYHLRLCLKTWGKTKDSGAEASGSGTVLMLTDF